ncbi:MAG: hypothetical protein M0R51_11730 [Clostridia bacterium]|jgi:hypothetical protein|nr:hypothetical protein [Clostridia bacterium]
MENLFSDIIADSFELSKQPSKYIKEYEKIQMKKEYDRYVCKHFGKSMDSFELAGLDYPVEEKTEIIKWCNNHDYPISKVISFLSYKKYAPINQKYFIELEYKKVKDEFPNLFTKMIHNIYNENELYMLTKLIKHDII